MSKPTPGPWQQGTTTNRKAMDTIFTERGGLQICKIDTSCPNPGENEANAAFIVKAVNCHEELVSLLKEIDQYVELGWKLQEKLDKAIANAEGK